MPDGNPLVPLSVTHFAVFLFVFCFNVCGLVTSKATNYATPRIRPAYVAAAARAWVCCIVAMFACRLHRASAREERQGVLLLAIKKPPLLAFNIRASFSLYPLLSVTLVSQHAIGMALLATRRV